MALLDDLARPLAFDVSHQRYAAVDFEAGAEGNPLLLKMLAAAVKEGAPRRPIEIR